MPTAQTDDIGDLLEKEYSTKDPNTHIAHFYIRLGNEIRHLDQKVVITELSNILKPIEWVKTEPNWDGLLFFEFKEGTNERQREMNIEEIRRRLKTQLQHLSASKVNIMFSRACLYKEPSTGPIDTDWITTDDIGGIMKTVYSDYDVDNAHIEYFYLFVQAEINKECFVKKDINQTTVNVQDMAIKELKDLPGKWKSVEPQKTWLGTIFGFYPKGLSFSEREREKSLNEEVRKPLRDKLEAQLAQETGRRGAKPTVHIILTRACKYTEIRMDTS